MPKKDGTLTTDEVRLLKHLSGPFGTGRAAKDSGIYRRCQRHVPLLVQRGYLDELPGSVNITDAGSKYATSWNG